MVKVKEFPDGAREEFLNRDMPCSRKPLSCPDRLWLSAGLR